LSTTEHFGALLSTIKHWVRVRVRVTLKPVIKILNLRKIRVFSSRGDTLVLQKTNVMPGR